MQTAPQGAKGRYVMQILTNSQRNCYGECPRKHSLRYEQGIAPAHTSEALAFGTLMHEALEAWWITHGDLDAAILVLQVEAIKPEADPFRLALARALMRGYHERWAGDLMTMEVVAVELEYRAPLLNPATNGISRTFELAGKIDAIAKLADGTLAIVEHKTTSESIDPASDYWPLLSIDGQVSGYYLGAQALGYAVETCLYDVIAKPGIRPSNTPILDTDGLKIVLDANGERVRTKDGKKFRESGSSADGYVLQTRPETPEEFEIRLNVNITADNFARRLVYRTESDMLDYLSDMWAVAANIREAENANRWPRNPRSCKNYGGCSFFPICSGMASADDQSQYIVKPAHEELSMSTIKEPA